MPKNQTTSKWYEINAAGESNDAAELLIYGDIGESWWGDSVTAQDLVTDLQGIDASTINVRVNSYGGSVKDGLAIYNALKRHDATIIVSIDGMAVSIASLIVMAGDTVEMAENAMLMIHAPWSAAVGNAKEMRETAELLDKHADAMATSYARKTGAPVDDYLAILKDGDDHWYLASEALESGLIDEIVDDVELDAAASLNKTRFPYPVATAAPTTKEAKKMPVSKTPAAEPKPANDINVDEVKAQAAAEALASETNRRESIRAIFKPHMAYDGMTDLENACLDDTTVTAAMAQTKILAKIAEGAEPMAGKPRIEHGESAEEKFRAGASASLAVRAGLQARDDASNNFRGHTLVELARSALTMHGVNAGDMSKMEMVQAAFTHTSSDFGNLLSNVANKAMLKGYDEAEETFQLWTAKGELSDFKATSRVDLNSFPSLSEVPDGAEFKHGTVGDRGETIQLATYGKLFSITRQTIINDDLGAFSRIPQRMGRAAIRTVGDLVYAVLTANPTMSDGTALFHADHGNLPTGAVISTAAVDSMRVAMGLQKDGDENAAALNIRMAYLLLPLALQGVGSVVRDSEYEVGASTKNNTTPNSVRNTFEVISDARLDGASSTAWYGAANGSMHDTVEVAYLDGNEAPYLEQQAGWNVDGAEFKVRIDAGVKALDFRTLAKNVGS